MVRNQDFLCFWFFLYFWHGFSLPLAKKAAQTMHLPPDLTDSCIREKKSSIIIEKMKKKKFLISDHK